MNSHFPLQFIYYGVLGLKSVKLSTFSVERSQLDLRQLWRFVTWERTDVFELLPLHNIEVYLLKQWFLLKLRNWRHHISFLAYASSWAVYPICMQVFIRTTLIPHNRCYTHTIRYRWISNDVLQFGRSQTTSSSSLDTTLSFRFGLPL